MAIKLTNSMIFSSVKLEKLNHYISRAQRHEPDAIAYPTREEFEQGNYIPIPLNQEGKSNFEILRETTIQAQNTNPKEQEFDFYISPVRIENESWKTLCIVPSVQAMMAQVQANQKAS